MKSFPFHQLYNFYRIYRRNQELANSNKNTEYNCRFWLYLCLIPQRITAQLSLLEQRWNTGQDQRIFEFE